MNAIAKLGTRRLMGLASIGFFFVGCGGADGQTADGDLANIETASLVAGKDSSHRRGHPPVACHGKGAGGAGGGHDAGGGPGGAVTITPNATGWIDASSNALGIQGGWYVFADGYGFDGLRDGACQAAGHADSECSLVTSPDPASHVFPNTAGRMCTSGVTAMVLVSNGVPDYPNMWGAGMGFDFAGSAVAGQPRGVFDAEAHGVIGVSFDIDNVPSAGLRVAFPTPGTEPSVLGPDYWGAGEFYPNSPVVAGTNLVLFSNVQSPEAVPQPVDVTQLEAMQFLIGATQTAPQPFQYCISNVKMLVR